MDPMVLVVLLVLTVIFYYACVINVGSDVPATTPHGHHGHDHHDDDPHGEPGEVAHPHEH